MAQNTATALMNNFTGGLKTEFTGLNFPENACTSADNCVFSIIGEVNRRGGFNFETNYNLNSLSTPSEVAQATYKWNNVGGDGSTQIVVQQVGSTLYFYRSSTATAASPLSTQKLASTVNISGFLATNAVTSFDPSIECTFADGNGYLFVFNTQCDPFYVSYNNGVLTATVITINVRDFTGLNDGLALSTRPPTLSPEHNYNLVNQGWNGGWKGTSTTTNTIGTGSFSFVVVPHNLPIGVGQTVTVIPTLGSLGGFMTGTVTSYDGITLVFTETANSGAGSTSSTWSVSSGTPTTGDTLSQWYNVLKNYPANSDVWWYYRNTNVTSNAPNGVFTPSLANTGYILPTNSQAPQGSITFPAFIQDRTMFSGVPGLTEVSTPQRPNCGAFYAGRVWYSGVNASFQPTGDADFYTWTETIYFSTTIQTPTDFGQCYQVNDPTSSTLFNLLPTDGGTIVIQGSGPIYKLFPIQNGLLVFAANGIWYITGGQAVGFAANEYTVNKISGVQSIGYHSYVNVLGWPIFWNAEGIYQIKPDQGNTPYGQGGYTVENLTLGTILSFYKDIPLSSKLYARGDYDPINYTIQWVYKSISETDITSRYQFDSALNVNTYKGPFYPYSFTISPNSPYIASILYVNYPGEVNEPDPSFEYLTVFNNTFTFSQENDFTTYTDWTSAGTGIDYTSSFTTGYMLGDKAQKLWQPMYVWVYSENMEQNAYILQGVWDYASGTTSGKISTRQVVNNNLPNFNRVFRRHKIRGHGIIFQLQITSVSGQPFDFMGWSILDQINAGA